MPRRTVSTVSVQGVSNLAPIGPDLYQILDLDMVELYRELRAEEPGIRLDQESLDVHLTHLPLFAGWSGLQMPPHHPTAPPHFSQEWWDELRPYQQEAAWLMRSRSGSLLLDTMGAGKSRTALAASDLPIVVFCPKSAVQVWEDESEYAGLRWRTLSGRVADESVFDDSKEIDVWILPWSVAGSWAGFFASTGSGPTVRTKIGDEIHEIQKAKTHASKGWRIIDAERIIGLTATPLRNRLKSLWSLLDGVQPKAWGSEYDFRRKYCDATEGAYGLEDGTPSEAVVNDLKKRLTNVIIRRTRSDLSLIIPPLKRRLYTIKLDDATKVRLLQDAHEAAIGDRFSSETAKKGGRLAWATAMRQGVGMLKAKQAPALLEDLLPAWSRAVVWVWHKEVADYLHRELTQHGVGVVDKIMGDTPTYRRKEILREWRDGDLYPIPPKILIASIGACSSAVAFLSCGLSLFVESDYAPLQMSQAEKRIHRPFQKHAECLAIYMTTGCGTIDHTMTEILLEKAEEAERVFSKDGEVDQMRALLGQDARESDQDFMARVAERIKR